MKRYLLIFILAILLTACTTNNNETTEEEHAHDTEHTDEHTDEHHHEHGAEAEELSLPTLQPVERGEQPLKVVATTSIIGDVVAQVGGETIALTTLIQPGQDPHAYTPGTQELTVVADAHVIFVNGWDLEESLVEDLENISQDIPLIPISANIQPLAIGEEGSYADPHVWLNSHHVEQWVNNVAQVLSMTDPTNETTYTENANRYLAELAELDTYVQTELAKIPESNRFLVTNHDAFAYFAHAYEFTVVGTVIPSASSLSEPSASDLVELIEEMREYNVCTIFTETTVSDSLAQTVSAELSDCEQVAVQPLYTGALGEADSGDNSYIEMFRSNVDNIVRLLQ